MPGRRRSCALLLPKLKPASKPEIEGPADARDDLAQLAAARSHPPALRLSPKFATNLKAARKRSRARLGDDAPGSSARARDRPRAGRPHDASEARRTPGVLWPAKGDWARIVSYSGDTSFADRLLRLRGTTARLALDGPGERPRGGQGVDREPPAVGLVSLDPTRPGETTSFGTGSTFASWPMIAYLRESFGQVSVSSLITGHRACMRGPA